MTRELTDEQIMEALGLDGYDSMAIENARAIIAADRALRVPMTDRQILSAHTNSESISFEAGIRAAERHHGIVGKEGA